MTEIKDKLDKTIELYEDRTNHYIEQMLIKSKAWAARLRDDHTNAYHNKDQEAVARIISTLEEISRDWASWNAEFQKDKAALQAVAGLKRYINRGGE